MTAETAFIIYGVVAVLICIAVTTLLMIHEPQEEGDAPEVVYGTMAGVFWPAIVAVAVVVAPFFAIHYLCRGLKNVWSR